MTTSLEHVDPPFPNSPGTYALIMRLPINRRFEVGKLGSFDFPAGFFIYVGSAFGPGGLAGRLARHARPVRPDSRLHWHVDYLRCWAPVVEIWFGEHAARREHEWASQIGRLPGCRLPAPRFGASDCRCPSHLFHFDRRPPAERLRRSLDLALPGDRPPQRLLLEDRLGS